MEAAQPARRRLQREAKHCMMEDDTEPMLEAGDTARNVGKYAQLEKGMDYCAKTEAILKKQREYLLQMQIEQGDKFDENVVMSKFARKSLLTVDSPEDLLLTAELLIYEDWLGKVDALPGNMYRLAVMGGVFGALTGPTFRDKLQDFAKMLGILSVCMVQICGPPMIFMSVFAGIGRLNERGYNWHCCPWHPSFAPSSTEECYYDSTLPKDVSYFDDWGHVATTKLLGILVMFMFLLNSLFVVMGERDSWEKIYNTFRYLDVLNPKFRVPRIYLYIDAIVNTWVIGWCCLDVFLVIGASQCPADVLLNALGLVFLYNLDDVGGDLGFVCEGDWPGERIAWIYSDLVEPCPDDQFDQTKLDIPGFLILSLYNMTMALLVVMIVTVPLLTVFTPFIQIVPDN